MQDGGMIVNEQFTCYYAGISLMLCRGMTSLNGFCCEPYGLQVIRMNIERFSIPELLFHPSDIGIQEMGIAEAIVHTISQTPPGSLKLCPNKLRAALWNFCDIFLNKLYY